MSIKEKITGAIEVKSVRPAGGDTHITPLPARKDTVLYTKDQCENRAATQSVEKELTVYLNAALTNASGIF